MEQSLTKITTFVFDVDGVLTDGTVLALADGEQVRSFNIKDGWAINKAMQLGFNVAIISAGKMNVGVQKRLEYLGIKDIYLGVGTKIDVFNEYVSSKSIDTSEILYMGDDYPDYDVLKVVGLPTCPKDAVKDIQKICQYVSTKKGGKGAVRDVIEKTIRAQNKWPY